MKSKKKYRARPDGKSSESQHRSPRGEEPEASRGGGGDSAFKDRTGKVHMRSGKKARPTTSEFDVNPPDFSRPGDQSPGARRPPGPRGDARPAKPRFEDQFKKSSERSPWAGKSSTRKAERSDRPVGRGDFRGKRDPAHGKPADQATGRFGIKRDSEPSPRGDTRGKRDEFRGKRNGGGSATGGSRGKRDDFREQRGDGGSHAKKPFGRRDEISSAPRPGGGRPGKKTAGETPIEGQRLKATVDKNRKGFGFLIFENRKYDDAFVPPRAADRLFHGDRVEVVIGSRGEVADLRVIAHRFREVVGRFTPHASSQQREAGWVVYERKKAREEIFAPKGSAKAKAGDWVRAKLEFHETGQHTATAEIVEVYGPDLPAAADIGMVAAEYNLIEEHTPGAVAEAESFKLEWDTATRRDLRQVPFITIDGETARDFDDAIFVERSENGHILWVAIADVSNYVKKGTELDEEALSRATSVYFPERAFHMLPRALSENLCSLVPHQPRLVLVSKMEFNSRGHRLSTEVFEGIIESKRRATYNEIQDEWEKNQKNKNWEFHPHFELYHSLRKARSERGSIDFDLPEAELKVKPTGEVISITLRARLDAHRLIEEMMIAANESVTEWALERHWPFIYRVHDEPAQTSLKRFEELAGHMGVQVSLDEGADIAQALADLIRRIDGHPAQAMLNMALLRSMKQAQYTATHGGHFGLASEGYTHFTSPIRRYPDLIVHRMLRMAVQVEAGRLTRPSQPEFDKLQLDLEEMAEHCSYRERIASDAEREAIKLKQVRAMTTRLGEEFDGKIIGLIDGGMFIEIRDPYVEGMVAADTIMDDLYQYDESRMMLIGRRTKRMFKMSDPVLIQVVRADIDRRQIDFALIRHGSAEEGYTFPASGIEAAKNRDPSADPRAARGSTSRERPAPRGRDDRTASGKSSGKGPSNSGASDGRHGGRDGRRDQRGGGKSSGKGRQDSPGGRGRVAKRKGR